MSVKDTDAPTTLQWSHKMEQPLHKISLHSRKLKNFTVHWHDPNLRVPRNATWPGNSRPYQGVNMNPIICTLESPMDLYGEIPCFGGPDGVESGPSGVLGVFWTQSWASWSQRDGDQCVLTGHQRCDRWFSPVSFWKWSPLVCRLMDNKLRVTVLPM